MHRDVLVPRSTGTCESGLARERGGQRTIQLPAVGARLRANTEGKSLCRIRPQADSYSANTEGKSLCRIRPQADSYSANTEGKSLCRIRPQADFYSANTAGKSSCRVPPQAVRVRGTRPGGNNPLSA